MRVTLLPSELKGTVTAPPSKSYMHRALILSSIADKSTKLMCTSFSEDIKATMSCLTALGASFEIKKDCVIVSPIDVNKKDDKECVLDVGESGSTFRFMLPFAAALGRKCVFKGADRLGKRPLLPLINTLLENGAVITHSESSFLPLKLSGKLTGTLFSVPGDVSSQFITGLLFALCIMGGGSITTTTPLQSAPYVEITTDILKKFGIITETAPGGYRINENQKCISPRSLKIEGDYSNAAFWLVAGAIGKGSIRCEGVFENSIQGDRKIEDILTKMGAKIKREEAAVTVYPSKLFGTNIDAADIPDIVPVICVASCSAEGATVITNTKRLREKESDRVESTVNMLCALGADIEADENTITIRKSALCGGIIDSANDHRIAMSGAIASLITKDAVTIENAGAVSKSYPDFFLKFQMLGGEFI